MTKQQAKNLIDSLLDARILDPDLVKGLLVLKNTICHGSFTECDETNRCRFCDEYTNDTSQK